MHFQGNCNNLLRSPKTSYKRNKKNAKLLFTLCSSQGVKKTKSVMPKNDLEKVAKFCTQKKKKKR